jgi:outer membrane immunogenic protein
MIVAFVLAAWQPLMAADIPVRMPAKAPAQVVAAVFNWTGCYVGAHGGYGWGRRTIHSPLTGIEFEPGAHDIDGAFAGGQVGCNVQYHRWVLGAEAQVAWADIEGQSPILESFGERFGWASKTDMVGSLAGRLGWAFGQNGQTLIFAKGGLGFARAKSWTTFEAPNTPFFINNITDRHMYWGWMIGGWVEHALNNHWSIKVEYNYMDFDAENVRSCNTAVPFCEVAQFQQHLHLVKAGINYRFFGYDLGARTLN